ncbi:MAG: phosphoribosyl-ATP diphosphatase [Oscillospiraceae bacterium]|jgi:phosphoribosyl-ATP pyrophosphohydrolase|nr:phosphoribosyl-ATP diphosphatase [Oscillospiraceae bacterium]
MSDVFNNLYELISERKNNPKQNSYTSYLFEKGLDKILKKCGEECSELIIAAKNSDNDELKNEIADLIYHVMVLCVESKLEWREIEEVLNGRGKKTGNLKQFHNTDNDML